MTMTAGFKCSDGFVLCADTQMTFLDYYKSERSKIRIASTSNCTLFFALAGDVDLAGSLIGKIIAAVKDSSTDPKDIRTAIETKCIDQFNTYPNLAQPAVMLIAHYRGAADPEFLKLVPPVVSPVSSWICLGTGEPLATYLISDIYRPSMTTIEVASLAAYALTHVKRHAYGCGGASQILRIDHRGKPHRFMTTQHPGDRNPEQENFEKYVVDVDRALKPFIFNTIKGELTTGALESEIQSLSESIRAAATQRVRLFESRREEDAAEMQAIAEALEEGNEGEKS